MGEEITAEVLSSDLRELGIAEGMTLVVHASLSSIGWVEGGAPTVVEALAGVLGPTGTLAMPAATPQCAGPGAPLFEPDTTPTTMGAIAEAFRRSSGTRRSSHPLESVCARGPNAENLTSDHPLAFSEGREGPFGKLWELESQVLLLGVGFNRCTALHLAESMVENRRLTTVRFRMLKDRRPVWFEVPNVADDNGTHFPIVGARYLATGRPKRGRVGHAESTCFPMPELVSFAVDYFEGELSSPQTERP